MAARNKKLDNTLLPIGYILTAVPYMWLGILLAWVFCIVLRIFPLGGGYDFSMQPSYSFEFLRAWLITGSCRSFRFSWCNLVVGRFGMRNLIIYELEADYSHYLEALGAPQKLIRNYAFKNAILRRSPAWHCRSA
jgi:peptide/nickel transport system permease protein